MEKEFDFNESDFHYIKSKLYKLTGISLSEHKYELVYSRLARRLRLLGLHTFGEYCWLLENTVSDEDKHFINALTTNKTSFFREEHHFEFLSQILPDLRKKCSTHELKIWSAGCSSGEEAYSIAMVLLESLPSYVKAKILATDVDTNILARAKKGVYAHEQISTIGVERKLNFFLKGVGVNNQSSVKVSDRVRSLIYFKKLNLITSWPISSVFQVIFCRNVLIYFDQSVQLKIIKRFWELLMPGGYLILGHSEHITGLTTLFDNSGRTIYKKLVR